MFSNAIEELLESKPIEILKMLARNDPERFRQDVSSFDKDGCSLFTSLLFKNSSFDFVKELYNLCEEFGYDFKGTTSSYTNRSFSRFDKVEKTFPEYISVLSRCYNDDVLFFLTEKMGKDEMLRLEKDGWHIMEEVFSKGHSKTIELLCSYGLNFEVTPSGVKILKVIEKNQKTVDLYWKIKEQRSQESSEMSDQQFTHFRKIIKDKIQYIDKKKDYRTESIIEIIKNKENILSIRQKEFLLKDSVACKDLSLFKALVKFLKYKLDSSRVQEIMMSNLHNARAQEFLYMALEKTENLFKKVQYGVNVRTLENGETINERDESKNVYGFEQVAKSLSKLDIHPFDRYYLNKRGNDGAMNKATTEKISKLFNSDHIWFEKMDNGTTMFDRIVSVPSYLGKFKPLLLFPLRGTESADLSIVPSLNRDQFELVLEGKKEFSPQQIREIKDCLYKTWLKHDKDGNFLLGNIRFGDFTKESEWLFSRPVIMNKEILSLDEKVKLFNYVLTSVDKHSTKMFENMSDWKEVPIGKPLREALLKNLYSSLNQYDNMRWKDIVITEDAQEILKNCEFLYELKARQLSQELKNNTQTTSDITQPKNVRVKI